MATVKLNTSGVYCITHIPSGLIYVGAAINIGRRWSVHRYGLRKGKHHSLRMQHLWDNGAPCDFSIRLLEAVPVPDLLAREQYWLDVLKPCNPAVGFNLLPFAHSTYGRVVSDAAREKMSACNRGRALSPEHRAAIAAALTGRKISERHKEIISARHKGKTIGVAQRAQISRALMGNKVSAATRQKISAFSKGRKFTDAQKVNMRGFRGKRHSAETKLRISLAKADVPRSPEAIAKTIAIHQGAKRSPESRARMSVAAKLRESAKRVGRDEPECQSKSASTPSPEVGQLQH